MDKLNMSDSMKNIEEKVFSYIEEKKLLERGDRVLAGVSGGADSVCLLFVLLALKERFRQQNQKQQMQKEGLHIEVVHVHHMIRGEEADRDMVYVQQLCQENGLICHVVKEPVEQIAAQNGWTVEEAGRKVRYEAFYRILKERKLNKIAVAHHRDDNAETVLMNLFRGTGLRGAAGIPAIRNEIIRPLLSLSRAEIENYLADSGISYCIDGTNQDCDYTRNKIRNQLIPYVEEHINTKATEHIIRFAHLADEIDEYFQKKANLLFEEYGRTEKNRVILKVECLNEDKIEVMYLIRKVLECVGSRKDISHEHMEQIIKLLGGRTGGKCQLPGGILVEKSYGQCIFGSEEEKSSGEDENLELNLEDLEENQPYTITFLGEKITFIKKKCENFETFPKKKYTKWFDCDKIKFTLRLRTRENGDYMIINHEGGRKKIKDYFIDAKIPREERDKIPLLAEGQEILWVLGMRISESYKVDEHTVNILEVQVQEEIWSIR